jgi:hypothetical protein
MKVDLSKLSIQHLWVVTALVGVFIFVNTHPIGPHDFWWHIAAGREIATTGRIPTVDVYSYTMMGEQYPSYQMYWLMEVVLYKLYHTGGPALVVFFQSLVITLAYFIVLMICWRRTQDWRLAAFGCLFAAALGINDWNVRPQAITFLLFALYLWAIDHYRRTGHFWQLVMLPVGMVIWVNSHGTFPLGLILIGIWWADETWQIIMSLIRREKPAWRRLVYPCVAMVLTGLVCLLNPRGTGVLAYLTTLTSNSVVQNLVPEWAPPMLGTMEGNIFYAGLLLSTVIFAVSTRRASFYQVLTFLIFAVLALKTSRGIVWYGLAMAPVLTEHMAAIIRHIKPSNQTETKSTGSPVLNRIFLFVLLAMALISLPWFKSVLPLPEEKANLISVETPIAATEYMLHENLPGRLFHAISFGSYLIWAGYPEYQVFVDPRIELFPPGIWRDYLSISNAQGNWQEQLNSYGVNTLMLSPEEQPLLVAAVNQSPEWRKVYEDTSTLIFVLNNPVEK